MSFQGFSSFALLVPFLLFLFYICSKFPPDLVVWYIALHIFIPYLPGILPTTFSFFFSFYFSEEQAGLALNNHSLIHSHRFVYLDSHQRRPESASCVCGLGETTHTGLTRA